MLECFVNPTGEIFDRDRGAGIFNLSGFAPFKRNLIKPFANAPDAIGSRGDVAKHAISFAYSDLALTTSTSYSTEEPMMPL